MSEHGTLTCRGRLDKNGYRPSCGTIAPTKEQFRAQRRYLDIPFMCVAPGCDCDALWTPPELLDWMKDTVELPNLITQLEVDAR